MVFGPAFYPYHYHPYSYFSGLLVSITIACYHHGKFIGVAGTDINIEDLMPDITEYFKQGRTTYAFMISRSGRTLIHPLLPAPADAYGDPIYMDIRNLEQPESKFKEVFESMAKYVSFLDTKFSLLHITLTS